MLAVLALGAIYLVLVTTVFAPVDQHGAKVSELTLRSRAVGEKLEISVVEPAEAAPRGERGLLVFLHGRGGSEETFRANEAIYRGLERLGRRAPVLAFPDGGDASYWHDRRDGDWGRYVMREVIPAVSQRFGIEPGKVAIGGISMGGFGAYNLALHHPKRFCAVGGHSAALWFEGGETAPGAFDGAADFERNDVVGTVAADPGAFGSMRIWNDYGRGDPFRGYNEGFVDYLEGGGTEVSAHSWPGGHDNAYWNFHWAAYLRFYANSLAHC